MTTRKLILLVTVLLVLLAACGSDSSGQATLPPPPTPLENKPPALVVTQQALPTLGPGERETAVAQSSPTPVETPTLAPTATPQSLPADPQSQPVTAGNLPAVSHDLLFIGDGALRRWQAASRQVVTLLPGGDEAASDDKRNQWLQPIVGDVADYALSQDGRRALVARLTHTTQISNTATAITETIHTYELSYLNLETGDRRVLVTAVSDIGAPAFALSPDGRQAAFGGLGLGEASALVLTADLNGQLYVVETETGAPPELVEPCSGLCRSMVWHQDNNFFVFGDKRGLLLYNLSASRPELLASSDDDTEFGRSFGPLSWAKNGRWLLLWLGTGVEGSTQAVFDVPTKQLVTIPHTFQYADPLVAELTWMQDDRLFMVRAETENGPAIGETWRVNMEAGAVQRDESVVLSTEVVHPTAPVHWADGRFGYGLLAEDGGEGTGLFQRIAFNEPAARVNAVPAALYAPEIAWLPDGSGAAIAQQGRLYYAPVDGALYDLATAVGPWAHSLTWLP